MATLQGQNLRIGIEREVAGNPEIYVVGMATNCTITLTNNTEDASHKDIVGKAATPTVVSKSWTLQCDSLDVTDAAALLTAIKAMEPLQVMFDETSTTDNTTAVHATFGRKGQAYFNDLTLTFNNRENSAKNIQMTGTSALSSVASTDLFFPREYDPAYTKGQFVRLFLSQNNTLAPANVLAAALTLQMHVSITLEDATTKDTTGDWQIQEPTAISYDITTNALVRSGETITSSVGAKGLADLETIYEAGTPVKWKIANTSGDNNRTASSTIVSGSAILTQLQVNGPNRQRADYTATLNGYGEFTVAA